MKCAGSGIINPDPFKMSGNFQSSLRDFSSLEFLPRTCVLG
jgi:hypothetical protein